MKKTKVLIVDDSALVRQTLTQILNSDSHIEVIGVAADPIYAARKILKTPPNVITLDLEMPRMNGLTFLQKIMSQYPIPVVVISSLTLAGTELSIKALEYGAIDIIAKPKLSTKEFFEESKIRICDAVKAAAHAKIKRNIKSLPELKITPKLSADKVLTLSDNTVKIKDTTDKIIVIGASTGGTNAIQKFLSSLPPDIPGIVIVQHMPEIFTKSFADRLNKNSSILVKEGANGDTIAKGKAIIAPGNMHAMIKRSGAKYIVEIVDAPLVNRHRPSVDVLFRSAAKYAGKNAIGIIMTGMGDDGAKGLLEMKQAGAYTIAQDEKSCVVYGMPRSAFQLGAVDKVLHLDKIAEHVYRRFNCP